MDDFLFEVIRQAGELGLGGWQKLILILVTAVLLVSARHAGKAVWSAIRNIKLGEQKVYDEGGEQPEGVELPTDPDNPGGDSHGG